MSTQAAGPATLSPETRQPGTVRTNRVVLALIGLILLAAGALALLVRFGVFGPDLAAEPVLGSDVVDFVDRSGWFWLVVGAVAAVLALLSLCWLLIQARSNRLGTVRIVEDTGGGPTILAAGALTDALEAEIAGCRGVHGVAAHLSEPSSGRLISIRVALDGRVSAAAVYEELSSTAIPHARQAVSAPELSVRVEFELPKVRTRDLR